MKIRLSIAAGSGVRTTFEHAGPVICIGRDLDCELALQGEAADMVSRQHARIDMSADGATLTDTGSSNGTLLNGRLLEQPAPVRIGDRIQMGFTGATLTILELDLEAQPAAGQAVRVWPALAIGSVAALALIAVLVAVFWPRPSKDSDEYAQGLATQPSPPSPPETKKLPSVVQPVADTGKQPLPLPPPAEDTEVLARGPVHEAYAQPVDYQPLPGPVVTMKPPDLIDELPPGQKPDGDDVQWLPGYWDWDEESKDYLWVSGLWRDAPPKHHWVPGAWQEVEGGWQWSPGLWASDESQKVDYFPYPPPPLDAEVAAPAQKPSAFAEPDAPAPKPSAAVEADAPGPKRSAVRAPGSWLWRGERWVWRPGFWVTPRPGWLWVPARYVWTPGGCVFIDGYWDHPLERRGLILAPVRIHRRIADGLAYVPQYVVRPDFFLGALFVGPARRHYHFGDHFMAADVKRGFVPWFDYRPTKHSFDPLYDHYRLAFFDDPAWDRNLRELYRARLAGEVVLPPRTFGQQQKVIADLTDKKTAHVNVLKDVNFTREESVKALMLLAKDKVHEERVTLLACLAPGAKFEPPHVIRTHQLKPEERVGEREQIQHALRIAEARREYEGKLLEAGTVHAKPADHAKVASLELPKAPGRKAVVVTSPPLPVAPIFQVRKVPVFRPPPPPRPPHRPQK